LYTPETLSGMAKIIRASNGINAEKEQVQYIRGKAELSCIL
jgi:hypothetical protein